MTRYVFQGGAQPDEAGRRDRRLQDLRRVIYFGNAPFASTDDEQPSGVTVVGF